MSISQGDIWLVEFYPKIGSEITKLRPAIVISYNTIGKLPLKTVVPITDWKENYKNYPWMIKVTPNSFNNLTKNSSIDCFQVKNFANERFIKKIGIIDEKLLKNIHETVVKTFNPLYQLN